MNDYTQFYIYLYKHLFHPVVYCHVKFYLREKHFSCVCQFVLLCRSICCFIVNENSNLVPSLYVTKSFINNITYNYFLPMTYTYLYIYTYIVGIKEFTKHQTTTLLHYVNYYRDIASCLNKNITASLLCITTFFYIFFHIHATVRDIKKGQV